MATSTLRWQGDRLGLSSATLEWDVINAASREDAKNASPASGPPIPKKGNQHPERGDLICDDVVADKVSPNLFLVRASYGLPGGGAGGGGDGDPNPLTKLPEIQWDPGLISEPIDAIKVDISSSVAQWIPIVNSSGDPYDPPISEDNPAQYFKVIRNEPRYDAVIAADYMGAVNTDNFRLPDGTNIPAGQCRCLVIMPTHRYNSQHTVIEVEYSFEWRVAGFKRRLLDQGFRGWVKDTSDHYFPSEIFHYSGGMWSQVTQPIRLNGKGLPLKNAQNPTHPYYIGVADRVLVENPAALPLVGVTVEHTNDAVWLIYDPKKKRAFDRFGFV